MPYCLCMNCGAEKDNVFAPCGNCEHSLKNMHEVAYALGLSERYTQRQELDEFRAQIRRGDVRGAGATLERILLMRPDLPRIRLLYAIVLYRLDNLDEAAAVRTRAGLFDVSHMGRLELKGPDAAGLLDAVLSVGAPSMRRGRARYNVLCTEEGGIIDDAIVYRRGDEDDSGRLRYGRAGRALSGRSPLGDRHR